MRNRSLIKHVGMVIMLTFAIIMGTTNMAAAAPASEEGDAPKVEVTKEPESTKEPEEKIFYSPKILVESYNYTVIPQSANENLEDNNAMLYAGSSIQLNIKLWFFT